MLFCSSIERAKRARAQGSASREYTVQAYLMRVTAAVFEHFVETANVDLLLSGDKDSLDVRKTITTVLILSIRDFERFYLKV